MIKEERNGSVTAGDIEKSVQEMEPEEGLAAWLNVLGSFLTHVIVFGVLYTFSLFVTDYTVAFETDRAAVSVVYQLQIAVLMGGGVFTGRLADTYGIRPVFTFGYICLSAGLLLASFATEFFHVILTQGLLVGIGGSFMYWPAATVVVQWFNKRRGIAVGIAVLGSGIGNFTYGLALGPLIEAKGTRFTLRILAAITLAVAVPTSLIMKRRFPNVAKRSFLSDKAVFRNRNFQLIVVQAIFFQMGYMIPYSAASPFIEDIGFTKSFAATAVAVIGVGSSFGRIILGFVADYMGKLSSFKTVMVGTGITCALWWFCQTQASLLSFSFFFGFFSGGFIALVPLVVSEYFGTERLGSIMGYVSICLLPGSILGPFLGGKFYDITGNYRATAIFTGCCVCFAAVVIMFLREPVKQSPTAENVFEGKDEDDKEESYSDEISAHSLDAEKVDLEKGEALENNTDVERNNDTAPDQSDDSKAEDNDEEDEKKTLVIEEETSEEQSISEAVQHK